MVARYYNCRLVRADSVEKGELWVEKGCFVPQAASWEKEVDLEGMLVAPGFIDIQINGAYGDDFTLCPESICTVAEKLPKSGVTAFCPTIVSSPKKVYKNLQTLSMGTRKEGSAQILGYHLEGPFINSKYCGAHNSLIISVASSSSEFNELYSSVPSTCMVTLAPEVPSSFDLAKKLIDEGVTVSLGHSSANEEQYERFIELGTKSVTHLFNAMKPFHHRDPGIIGSVLTSKNSFYSMILDPWHLHPTTVLLAWQLHPEGLILVTDAIAGMGFADGVYTLGNRQVTVHGNKAVLSGTETLAGSVATLDSCVRRLREITSCSIPEAISTVTKKPASLLGIYPKKGSLEIGADADFVVLDDFLHVRKTFVGVT